MSFPKTILSPYMQKLVGIVILVSATSLTVSACGSKVLPEVQQAAKLHEATAPAQLLEVPSFIGALVQSQPGTSDQKTALQQLAAAYWHVVQLSDDKGDEYWIDAYGRLVDADACLHTRYSSNEASELQTTVKNALMQTQDQRNKLQHMDAILKKYNLHLAAQNDGCVNVAAAAASAMQAASQ